MSDTIEEVKARLFLSLTDKDLRFIEAHSEALLVDLKNWLALWVTAERWREKWRDDDDP